MTTYTKELKQAWDKLIELGVPEIALQLVTNINGYNENTLEQVLYAHTGYNTFDQLEDA